MTTSVRRIVYLHTAGPYPGLRQILAMAGETTLTYLHTGEVKTLAPGPMPDILAPIQLGPDGRVSKGFRLKSTPRYVLYREELVQAAQAAPGEAIPA